MTRPVRCGARASLSWLWLFHEWLYVHRVVLAGGKPFFEAGIEAQFAGRGAPCADVRMQRYPRSIETAAQECPLFPSLQPDL